MAFIVTRTGFPVTGFAGTAVAGDTNHNNPPSEKRPAIMIRSFMAGSIAPFSGAAAATLRRPGGATGPATSGD
jgi:hypothetical protein